MTETVYLAGLGISSGGVFSLQVFSEVNDAKEYVEEQLEDYDDQEREWSTEPVIDHHPGEGLSSPGKRMYYGFEKFRKGFIQEKELK